ncbi:hypothetical protein J2S34_000213 [Nitrobacter winogradskyi]|uniref:Uncharacterized protein n=1 Tax=Nitrobacter winogradskyi TaxID=913 RepID=A0ACC6ADM1_NITWI|nr:hypothetical protein [Nitrobacter winogradskyi]
MNEPGREVSRQELMELRTSDNINLLKTASAGSRVPLGQSQLRGRERVGAVFALALAAYNLIRLPKLLLAPT